MTLEELTERFDNAITEMEAVTVEPRMLLLKNAALMVTLIIKEFLIDHKRAADALIVMAGNDIARSERGKQSLN